MRLEKVYLKQVGPFDELTLEFPKGSDPDKADVYLLTGPNGCGKSTILYAIAATLGAGTTGLGSEHISPRMRGFDSMIESEFDEGVSQFRVTKPSDHSNQSDSKFTKKKLTLRQPFYPGRKLFLDPGVIEPISDAIGWSDRNSKLATASFAVFAYAGLRTLDENAQITSIQEPQHAPLEGALSFAKPEFGRNVAQAIANLVTKEALSLKENDSSSAERYANVVRTVEKVFSQIANTPFQLKVFREPLSIKARLADRIVPLHLLSDGMVSLLSWIMDILVRLDRMPWDNEVPLLQRPFLLLLDEIDVHLHPAWQRRILPIAQRLFPNAQIIASSHSPFVIGSASDVATYKFGISESGNSNLENQFRSQRGVSNEAILHTIFGVEELFDVATQLELEKLKSLRDEVLQGKKSFEDDLVKFAKEISRDSIEVRDIVGVILRQTEKRLHSKDSR